MDRVLALRRSCFLAGFPPFNPLHPLYKRHRFHTSGPSHRELLKILTMSTTYETSECPMIPSFTLGGEFHGSPYLNSLWVLGTLTFINLDTCSPYHPVGMNHFSSRGLIIM